MDIVGTRWIVGTGKPFLCNAAQLAGRELSALKSIGIIAHSLAV